MKVFKFIKDFIEWLWDWYVLPVVSAFLPNGVGSDDSKPDGKPAPHDHGQTLDEE